MRVMLLDTETGGLNPQKHSLLEVGVVWWTAEGAGAELEILVLEDTLHVDPRSLSYNKVDFRRLADSGMAPPTAVATLEDFVRRQRADINETGCDGGIVIGGHNVAMDVGFLKRAYSFAGKRFEDVFSHRTIDTASIVNFLSLSGRLPLFGKGLDDILRYFEIAVREEERHTALGDARAEAELLSRLVQILHQSEKSCG